MFQNHDRRFVHYIWTIHISTNTHTHTHTHTYVDRHIYIYSCLYPGKRRKGERKTHTYIARQTYLHIFTYLLLFTYIYIFTFIYIYLHMRTLIDRSQVSRMEDDHMGVLFPLRSHYGPHTSSIDVAWNSFVKKSDIMLGFGVLNPEISRSSSQPNRMINS